MTNQQFTRKYVLPFVKANDKPFNRQLYNDTKDQLYKDGLITEDQNFFWSYPETAILGKLFE